MNRAAKGFRVFGGILILLNLVAVFLPVTVCTQENYPTLTWSAYDYIRGLFGQNLPYGEAASNDITSEQMLWVAALMIAPVILALIACIWGMVGSARQVFSSILGILVSGMYVGMVFTVSGLWPADTGNSVFSHGIACLIHLILAGLVFVISIIALALTPRKQKAKTEIPQINEIKQEKIKAKYSMVTKETTAAQTTAVQGQQNGLAPKKQTRHQQPLQTVGAQPRGVMVGLTGMYAGAEIPFTDGNYIKLGRAADNHLMFENERRVSRNHCSIKWDSERGKYTIYDYSSSGTYVNGSEDCIPQNLEIDIMPGSVIAIGDAKNTFRLE
ncbi:MAG: FHA domain-containing protein [Lachnospiraceae bacterium]|nr:FHA domain-containing protein [Lachnospiraceae bacterium]